MKEKEKEIINLFWEAIEKNKYTWEDLNKGKNITFTYNWKEHTVNTRLGNFWLMNISQYQKMIEQRALDSVLKESK